MEASGSGDVAMNTEARAVKNTVVGLSGRALRLNPDWVNPSGVFKLGLKPGFEFFPQGLANDIVSSCTVASLLTVAVVFDACQV